MINRLLVITLMVSVLLFGSVEIWSATAVCFTIFTLGLIWTLKGEYRQYNITGPLKLILVTALALIAYGAFQIVPLPSSVIRLLAPATFQLQSFYSIDNSSTMPLSFNVYQTVSETVRWAAFFTVFYISTAIFSGSKQLRETLKELSIFGFTLAIFAIVQQATWQNGIYWFRELNLGGMPFGPFVNRNHFAGLIGMLIPLGLGLALTRRTREMKVLYSFMAVIMAVSLFFSLSRGGIISFFCGMAVFSLMMVQGRSRKVWLIVFFVSVVLSYVIYLGIDPVIKRFYETDISGEERLVVWSATWSAIKDFWLTGSGLGSFINIFPLYAPFISGGIYDHAHNDYLEFFLEAGLIGTILLAVFAALMTYAVIKNPLQGRNAIFRAAAISAVFTIMAHSFFDFNLHILSNLLMFAYVLGMVAGLSSMGPDEEKVSMLKEKTEENETDRMIVSGPSGRNKRVAPGNKRAAPLFEYPVKAITGDKPAGKFESSENNPEEWEKEI
jgi:O-antigen ligase